MLTNIIFLTLVGLTYIFNLIYLGSELSFGYITMAMICSVVVEIANSGLWAILICKILPDKLFLKNFKIFNVSKKEYNFYINKCKIKSWKDKILDLGHLNGFQKKNVENTNSPEYLRRFIIECNSGFLEHLLSVITGTLIIYLFPAKLRLTMGVPTLIINFIINGMSIMVLRFNIPRLHTALKFAERSERKKELPSNEIEENEEIKSTN